MKTWCSMMALPIIFFVFLVLMNIIFPDYISSLKFQCQYVTYKKFDELEKRILKLEQENEIRKIFD